MKRLTLFATIMLAAFVACSPQNPATGLIADGVQTPVKIGVVTDLTGPASYWGESTRVGAELAAQELKDEGYEVDLIFESYPLSAKEALTAAQKLVNIDDVDAIYSEFNPGAIAVGSFVKELPVLHVYDAAAVSPLEGAPYTYKTYLNYKAGCREITQRFKDEGVRKIGVLKINLEFGELCLEGVKEIYDYPAVESYDLGDQDFRTQFLKLKNAGAEAVINVGFEGDTLNALKVIKEQKLNIRYGTVADTITNQVTEQHSTELTGSLSFGFVEVDPKFKDKLTTKLSTDYAAALAYTHIKQIVKAISACGDHYDCIAIKMDAASSDSTIGFQGFKHHIAELEMQITSR